MRNYVFESCFLGLLLLSGCSSDIDEMDEEQPVPSEEGAYTQENRWIYSQMNHYYLWREDLPDSASCHYQDDPVSFFKSLLSPRDRFSYCEHNPNYTPGSRTIDDIINPHSIICDSVICVDSHRIGYLCYKEFGDVGELEPVLKHFYESGITDMVLDLRYNGGGYLSTCQYLCTSIAPEEAYGKVLQYLQYNDVVTKERIRSGQDGAYYYWFNYATNGTTILGHHIYGLQLNKLYVLVSKRTASASESTIICLRPYMDVITIGERTTGKGVGMQTLHNSNCKYQLVPIIFQYYNAAGETVPIEGMLPDIVVEGGLDVNSNNLPDLEEPLLKKAVGLILNS